MEMELAGKVAIVTGAATGFGRGIARSLAANGCAVVVADLQEGAWSASFDAESDLTTVELIQQEGGAAFFQKCDVTKKSDVDALVAETVRRYGKLDVMVNNAGIYRSGKLVHEFTEDDLDACLNVNAKGSFLGAQAAIRQFLAQGGGGNIINVVSIAGLQGHPRQSVYNISKGAQANLTRCLAIEYGRDGIRVNGICPTFSKTALTKAKADDPDFDEMFVESIPLKRWGEVDDIASLAVFLASERSSYMHGALVKIDGGESLCRYSV